MSTSEEQTDFGFSVWSRPRYDYVIRDTPNPLMPAGVEYEESYEIVGTGYTVELPHQCGSWEVLYEVVGKDKAIREMEEFIRQAQEALDKLRNLE